MSWYGVYTQALKEGVAEQNLARQGFGVYLPRYRKRRRHSRRIDLVIRPLFPRYLFIKIDLEHQRWRSVNGTIGVCHILSDGDQPMAIPDEIIDAIRDQENDGGITIAPPSFVRGQKLLVTDGPLADLSGIFECVDDKMRVVMLLEFMGRHLRTHLPGHAVTAA